MHFIFLTNEDDPKFRLLLHNEVSYVYGDKECGTLHECFPQFTHGNSKMKYNKYTEKTVRREASKWKELGKHKERSERPSYSSDLPSAEVTTLRNCGLDTAQAVRLAGIPKVARSILTRSSKSCDLQHALHRAIRGAQGLLLCVVWGVRPVNKNYRF